MKIKTMKTDINAFWGYAAEFFVFYMLKYLIENNLIKYNDALIDKDHKIGDDKDSIFGSDITLSAIKFSGKLSIDIKASFEHPYSCSITKCDENNKKKLAASWPFFGRNQYFSFFIPVFHNISKLYCIRAASWLLNEMELKENKYYLITQDLIERNLNKHSDDIFIFEFDDPTMTFKSFMKSNFSQNDYNDLAKLNGQNNKIIDYINGNIKSICKNKLYNNV